MSVAERAQQMTGLTLAVQRLAFIGILRLNRELDRERLSRSAADAGVSDLLERALFEAKG